MEVLNYSKIEFLPKDPSISVLIRSFAAEDIEEVASLLSKNMPERHPFWIAMEFTPDSVNQFFRESMDLYLREGFSLVAVSNQKIIGFISAFDYYNNLLFHEHFKTMLEKSDPIQLKRIESSSIVYEGISDFKKPEEKGISMIVRNLVVDQQFEGKGLGSLLLGFVNYHPKCLKYPMILIEFAAKSTEIMGLKLGFEILSKKKWEDMTKDGERPLMDMSEKLKNKGISLANDSLALGVLKR